MSEKLKDWLKADVDSRGSVREHSALDLPLFTGVWPLCFVVSCCYNINDYSGLVSLVFMIIYKRGIILTVCTQLRRLQGCVCSRGHRFVKVASQQHSREQGISSGAPVCGPWSRPFRRRPAQSRGPPQQEASPAHTSGSLPGSGSGSRVSLPPRLSMQQRPGLRAQLTQQQLREREHGERDRARRPQHPGRGQCAARSSTGWCPATLPS